MIYKYKRFLNSLLTFHLSSNNPHLSSPASLLFSILPIIHRSFPPTIHIYPVPRLLAHVSCLSSTVLRLLSRFSRLLPHASCLMSPVSHLLSHVSCLTASVLHLKPTVFSKSIHLKYKLYLLCFLFGVRKNSSFRTGFMNKIMSSSVSVSTLYSSFDQNFTFLSILIVSNFNMESVR